MIHENGVRFKWELETWIGVSSQPGGNRFWLVTCQDKHLGIQFTRTKHHQLIVLIHCANVHSINVWLIDGTVLQIHQMYSIVIYLLICRICQFYTLHHFSQVPREYTYDTRDDHKEKVFTFNGFSALIETASSWRDFHGSRQVDLRPVSFCLNY